MPELNKHLVMTTCKCRENNNNLVMTRAWFEEMLKNKIAEGARKEQERIIKLLEEQDVCDFCEIIALIKGETND